jgi:hypothetical protein
LVAGLFILKHMENLSDEALCERWVENPYYQFFCGELSFCHEAPLAGTRRANRAEATVEELPVDLLRQKHQRMLQVDDLIQPRQQQVGLTVVSRLGHLRSPESPPLAWGIESHTPPKTGFPKRKKASRNACFLAKLNT